MSKLTYEKRNTGVFNVNLSGSKIGEIKKTPGMVRFAWRLELDDEHDAQYALSTFQDTLWAHKLLLSVVFED